MSKTVLVVEDDNLWLALHSRELKIRGFSVLEAQSPSAALDALRADREGKIACALIDHLFAGPNGHGYLGRSGIDVINEARTLPRSEPLRFALVTESSTVKIAGEDYLLIAEHDELVRRAGAGVLVLSKRDFQANPEVAYEHLARAFLNGAGAPAGGPGARRLAVGLGIDATVLTVLLRNAGYDEPARLAVLDHGAVVPLGDFVARAFKNESAELPQRVGEVLNTLLSTEWEPGNGAIPVAGSVVARAVGLELATGTSAAAEWLGVQEWHALASSQLQVLDVLAYRAERGEARAFTAKDYCAREITAVETVGASAAQRPLGAPAELGSAIRLRDPQAARVARAVAPLRKQLGDREADDEAASVRFGLGKHALVLPCDKTTGAYCAEFDVRLVLYAATRRDKGGRPKKPRKSR
jgi:CheY-like chemotaxis protein